MTWKIVKALSSCFTKLKEDLDGTDYLKSVVNGQ